jgi:serine/threonine protein kinase
MSEIQPGTNIQGYIVQRRLGTGGMGNLYIAHDSEEKTVTLKFPHISMIGDSALFERYQRELAIGKLLRHPRVQHVQATGDYEGNPFMVTDYIEGVSLREYFDKNAPLSVTEAIHILDGLCQGVSYCHEQGVFHRDLKPENIVMNPEGDPVIIDFGIALLRGARRITWNGVGGSVGTPDYMAPEQIEGKRGDARTDIYALGAMGYEMLTGQPPFTGDNPLSVMNQHLHGEIKSLRESAPDIPESFESVILKSLQRNPDDRYQIVEEFRQAILNHATIRVRRTSSATKLMLSPLVRQILGYAIVILSVLIVIITLLTHR